MTGTETSATATGGCLAIIPARGGSKGIPGKNLQRVGGQSLIARTIAAAASARSVDRTYVSTDDVAIAEEARRAGAEVIERPQALASDEASSESALLHALDALRDQGVDPAVLVFLQCTSPFTSAEDIDATAALVIDSGADSAFTAVPWHGFLWTVDGAGGSAGVGHDPDHRPRRQDLPPTFLETGAVYAMRVAGFRDAGHRFFGTVRHHVVDRARSIEIDDHDDLAVAELVGRVPRPAPVVAVPTALVLDFDGVLTDDRVITDEHGTEAVVSSRGDGLGLERLRAAGLRILVLSKERNRVVAARCEKLQVEVVQGIDDKVTVLEGWASDHGVDLAEVAYVGNDVNDLACMAIVGQSFAPSDAHPDVLRAADVVLGRPGGRGAVRELADLLIARL
jgi:YrbI family 3-deoxy-D-manno-octulosonate 8-phosphate phosphatase